MVPYFKVVNRTKGHWDIHNETRRMFCIRGELGSYYIRDERSSLNEELPVIYKTISACMGYIIDQLMFED